MIWKFSAKTYDERQARNLVECCRILGEEAEIEDDVVSVCVRNGQSVGKFVNLFNHYGEIMIVNQNGRT